MNYVVGSGPAGVFAAFALLGRGQRVTMLDAGNQLEPTLRQSLVQLQQTPRPQWTPGKISFLKQNVAPDRKGVGLKYAYGSDYPYRDVDRFTPLELKNVNLTASLAAGGFSTVWGAAMMPYAQHDLAGWPITQAQLAPHYVAVLAQIDYSAVADDLAEKWPLYHDHPTALRPSLQAKSLLDKIRPSLPSLKDAGIFVGSSRLAVRAKDCVYCGLCMYGCPYELIFNSAQLLPRLMRDPNFTYTPGVIVQRVNESAGEVTIHAISKQDSSPLIFVAERVYLGAGVLNSTRILLESMQAYDTPITLADSSYFLVPWMRWRGQRGVATEPLHTLSQLFLEILDPAVSANTVHLQLYTYNDLYVGAIKKMLGPAYGVMRPAVEAALGRLHILQGYLHSTESPSIELRLRRDGDRSKMTLTSRPAISDHRTRIGALMKKLARHRRQLGGFPVKPMLNIPDAGRGFHNGGTFPMRNNPGPFQSDTLGRPPDFSRVHLIDSSTFPTVPATTITLSVMANAHRIGSVEL